MMSKGTVILFLWLIIGAAAAGQRGYFSASTLDCTAGATMALTIVAGHNRLTARTRPVREKRRSFIPNGPGFQPLRTNRSLDAHSPSEHNHCGH